MYRQSYLGAPSSLPPTMKARANTRVQILAATLALAASGHLHAQSTLYWRSEAGNGSWNDLNNWWSGGTMTPPGSEILRFDNNVQLTMTNDAANTTRHRIIFDAGASDARTIGGSTANGFVAVGGNAPMIQNNSTATHALNFPITLGTDGLVVDTVNGALSLGGTISGSGFLTKSGANLLTLTGTNSYAGVTSVNAGTLSISTDANLGTAPGTYTANQLTLNGGTLKVTGSGLTINTNRGITIGASGATLDNSAMGSGSNANFNSKITGTGTLTLKANGDTSDTGGGVGGNLTLGSSANDFTGNITIQSGVVNFASDASFGHASNTITISGGGFVCTAASNSLAATRSIILSGGGDKIFRVYGSSTFTINGAISGTGNVRHTDGGTLVLNGANTFTGNLLNAAGTVAFNGTTASTYTGYTHLTNSSTLRLDASNMMPDTTDVLLYGGTTFNVNGKNETISGVMVGGSSDTTATINLGPALSTGTLTVTDIAMPGGSPTNVGGNLYAKITGTGSIQYANATSNTALWDLLNTANNFTGNVIVTRGRLRVALNGGLGSFGDAANDLVFNGDPVETLNNGEGRASLQGASSGALTLPDTRDIILNSGKEGTLYVWGGNTYTINGKVTGGGNLRKEDSGVLLLNNTGNDWSGSTKVVLGELRVGAVGALSPATTVIMGGATLNLNGKASSVVGLTGTNNGSVVNGGTTLTVTGSGNYDYAGRVTDTGGATTVRNSGSGQLTLSGTQDNAGGRAAVDSGTLVLAKSSTAGVHAVGSNNTAGLTITGGTARLGGTGGDQIYFDSHVVMSGGTFDLNALNEGFRGLTGGSGTITNDGATASLLTIGQSSVAADLYDFGGSIENGSSTIDLVKTGAGTLRLSGASTYSGYTDVTGGGLIVDGSLGATYLTVFGAATLAGNGSVGDLVEVKTGGGLATTISDWNGAAGTGFTDLAIATTLTWEGTSHFITVNTSGMVNFSESAKSFPIAIASGGISGFNAADFTVTPVGFTGTGSWSVQATTTTLSLVYTPLATGGYNDWAVTSGNAPTGGVMDDYDGDGVENGVEFVLGGDKDTNDLGKLPAAATDGSNMTFTFLRDISSIGATTSLVIEVGSDLAGWDEYSVPETEEINIPGVSVTDNGDGTDTVVLTVPMGPESSKFARLKVIITQP